jgi:hypothetical protein
MECQKCNKETRYTLRTIINGIVCFVCQHCKDRYEDKKSNKNF